MSTAGGWRDWRLWIELERHAAQLAVAHRVRPTATHALLLRLVDELRNERRARHRHGQPVSWLASAAARSAAASRKSVKSRPVSSHPAA